MNGEGRIQTSIKKELERRGWFVTKLIQCSDNGMPDLMALRNGETLFVECKTPEGRLSPLQVFRVDQLRKLGFKVIVATNKTDLDERPVTNCSEAIHKSGNRGNSNRQ